MLAFTATGLPPGVQVSAVFDDGAAGAGPFLVGADGTLAGVITLPAATGAGTHELRLFGVEDPPSVQFAVVASRDPSTEVVEPQCRRTTTSCASPGCSPVPPPLVLLVALVRLAIRLRRRPRAA